MRAYLGEMMPPGRYLAAAALVHVAPAGFARRIHGESGSLLSPYTLLGIWSVFDLLLILRLMDELKDRDIDRALFPRRPLPSGRVLERDIRLSLAAAMGLYALPSLLAGVLGPALAVLAYALLMFRRFFAPRLLRRSLLLTLATHTPIVPLMVLHGLAIFAAEHGRPLRGLDWWSLAPVVAMVWSGFLSWELSRKIRSAPEETEYVTYSRVLGPRGAVTLLVAVQAVGLACGALLFARLSLSWTYLAILLGASGVAAGASARFLAAPGPRTSSRLRPCAEVFLLGLLAAGALELGWGWRG
jgi:4-hydroxybenzoate polyprenyltransferase